MRIVLVCGDGHWADKDRVYREVAKEHKRHPITYLIQGGASGADECGLHAALWNYHGRKAGPIRNQQQLNLGVELAVEGGMISGAEQKINMLVLAFHSDLTHSKGTKDMVNRARKRGVKVRIIESDCE